MWLLIEVLIVSFDICQGHSECLKVSWEEFLSQAATSQWYRVEIDV